jgi:hypothetical protein
MPPYIKNGLADGSITYSYVPGGSGMMGNQIKGIYGGTQLFYEYNGYNH